MALSGTNGLYGAPAAASDGDPGGGLVAGGSLPRIVKVDSSTGCTLTRAQVKGLTPAEFSALANKETDLARVIASAAEAKALGVEERGLATLLTSSITNIKPLINKVNVAEQSIILPYIQRRQRSLINANYFAIETGEFATGQTLTNYRAMTEGGTTGQGEHGQANGALRSDDWVVTVSMGSSDWKTPLDNIERYFLPGSYVIVSSWIPATGDAFDSQFEVVGTANIAAGATGYGTGAVAATASTPKCNVILRPVGADVPKAGLSGGGSHTVDHYKPSIGIVQTIANNVNDYEAWCYNQPTDLSVRLIVNWLQTTRETRIVNQEYKETLAKIMDGKVNPFLNSMIYNPLAEQNRLAAQVSQDQWTRATWYNQAIAQEQTPETYMSLPSVADPEDPNCTLEYKSNALGIKTLLYEGNRVKDNLGQPLNLDSLFGDLYYLKRNREQDGDRISTIDCMTDRITANLIFEAMNTYYKSKYSWDVNRNVGINEKVTHNGIILFQYNIYDIPEVGVQLAVFHDPMFDDILNVSSQFDTAFTASTTAPGGSEAAATTTFAKSRNRALWLIDWSDVKIGVAGSNSVTRKSPSPEVDRLYRCRMDSVEREYSLRSTKWTTMLDRPHRHLLIENFDENVTVTAGTSTISKEGSLNYVAPTLEGLVHDGDPTSATVEVHSGGSVDNPDA